MFRHRYLYDTSNQGVAGRPGPSGQLSRLDPTLALISLSPSKNLKSRKKERKKKDHSRLDPQPPCIIDKLVQPEVIRLFGQPGEFDTFRAVRDGSDAVLPVPVGYVVSCSYSTLDGNGKRVEIRGGSWGWWNGVSEGMDEEVRRVR